MKKRLSFAKDVKPDFVSTTEIRILYNIPSLNWDLAFASLWVMLAFCNLLCSVHSKGAYHI